MHGAVHYPFDEIVNFYIIYKPPETKMLFIKPKGFFRPQLHIPLLNHDPVVIREILGNFIDEDLEKEDEPVSEFFGRFFKF